MIIIIINNIISFLNEVFFALLAVDFLNKGNQKKIVWNILWQNT